MKNRNTIIAIILLILTTISLIGCKKDQVDDVEAVSESESSEPLISEEIDESENQEIIEDVPISFECMEEIKEASPESGLVQVDDMLLQYGCKVSEIIEIIENSQSLFVPEDYNENELVTPNYPILIVFKKNGENYFGFVAENISDETVSLKDCTVTRIDSYKASKGNVFNFGFKGENNNIITYEYIKNLMENYEIIMEASEIDTWEGNVAIRQINLTYAVPSERSLSPSGLLRVEFIFESDTGELKTLKISD